MTARVVPTDDHAAALAILAGVEPHAVDGATVAEMVEGCAVLDVIEGGRRVGAVALEVVEGVGTITAAARQGRASRAELEQIEAIARGMGARVMRLHTKRPGLVRSMLARGYALRVATVERGL